MSEQLPPSEFLAGIREKKPDLLGNFTDPQTAEFLWQRNVVSKGEEERYDKDLYFQALGTYRNDIDFWDSVGRGASRGWYAVSDALDLADQAIKDATGGFLDPIMFTDEEYAERRAARDLGRKKNPYSYEDLNKLMAITADDSSFDDWMSNIWDISLVGGLLSESVVQFAPALAATAAIGMTGGAAAPVLAPLATFLIQSGIVGSSAFHEYLKEEEGVVTKEDYLEAFSDPDVMNRAVEHGAKYGVPVAALDAFSLGIAGKLPQIGMAARRAAGMATKTDNIAAIGKAATNAARGRKQAQKFAQRWLPEVVAQGGLGASGEILGSLWATGKVNQGEAFLEAILEPMSLPLELAVKSPKLTEKYWTARTRKKILNLSEEEVKRQARRRGINTEGKSGDEIRASLMSILKESQDYKDRNTKQDQSNKEEYLDEVDFDVHEAVFPRIPMEQKQIDSWIRRDQEATARKAKKIKLPPVKNRTLNAALLAPGQAKTLVDLGYIKELKEKGKYVITRKGLRAMKSELPTTGGTGETGEEPEGEKLRQAAAAAPKVAAVVPKETETDETVEETTTETEETPEGAAVEGIDTTEEIVEDEAPQGQAPTTETLDFYASALELAIETSTAENMEKDLTSEIAKGMTLIDESTPAAAKVKVQRQFLNIILTRLQTTKAGKPRKRKTAAQQKAIDIVTRQIKGAEKIMGSDRARVVVEDGKQNATTKVLDAKEQAKKVKKKSKARPTKKTEEKPKAKPVAAPTQEQDAPIDLEVEEGFEDALQITEDDDIQALIDAMELDEEQIDILVAEQVLPQEVYERVYNEAEERGQNGEAAVVQYTKYKIRTTKNKFERGPTFDLNFKVVESQYDRSKEIEQQNLNQNFIVGGLDWLKSLIPNGLLRQGQRGPGAKGMLGNQGQVKDGEEATARLNVSTYQGVSNYKNPDSNVPRFDRNSKPIGVITVKTQKGSGPFVNAFHDSHVVLENVTFEVNQSQAQVTAKEGGAKNVHAEVKGTYRPNIEAFTTDLDADGNLQGDVVPVGYNPKIATLFIDLRNGRPLKSAPLVTVVGDRAYAKGITEENYLTREELPNNFTPNKLADLGIVLTTPEAMQASEIANDIERENTLDNTKGTLPPENQRELIQWIQERVGPNIAVAFERVKRMTETVKAFKNLPSNIEVQGYANPIDKIIVLALDREYSKETAGEEAFHIAARLLYTEEELAVLSGYDWVDIANSNGIDVSQYSEDMQEWEALAKVAAKFLTGEKVVNIGPNNNTLLGRLKTFLNQLADYVRGRGWKKHFPSPQDMFISFNAGELVDRGHNPYPLGPQSEKFDLMAEKVLDDSINNYEEKQAEVDKSIPAAKDRGLLTPVAQAWAYFQEAFNHPNFYAAKNFLFRPIYKIMEEMREYQDTLLMEGLEALRGYALSTKATQKETDQFVSLMDFLTTRNNWIPEVTTNEDGSMTFTMPTLDQVKGQDIEQKLKVLYPEGINGVEVKLSQVLDSGDIIPRQYTLSGQIDKNGISPAQAFTSYYQGAEYQKNLLIQAIMYKLANMPKDATIEDLQNRIRYLTATVAESYQEETKEGEPVVPEGTSELILERDLAKKALEYIEDLNSKPYWIPRVRQGDRSIVVKSLKDGKPKTVQHFEVYDIKRFESRKAFDKMIAKRTEDLKEQFPQHNVEDQEFSVSALIDKATSSGESFTVISGMSLIEALLAELSHPESDNSKIDKVIALIKSQTEGEKLSGVGDVRQAQNITGHWRPDLDGYVNAATNSNLHTMTYQLAKVIYKPMIDKEHDGMLELERQATLDEQPVRAAAIGRTYRYTKKYLEFVNNPKTQGAVIRNIVFHTALGGRVSSATLNLMQLPQALLPFLYSVNPDKFLLDSPYAVAKNTAIMGKAFKDAMRLSVKGGWGKLQTAYSMELEGDAPSYLDADEWQMLRVLFGRGILSPVNLEDLTDKVKYQSLVRDGTKVGLGLKGLDNVADLSSWMFGSTEFLNRATTALAMYRIAKENQTVLNRMDKIRNGSHFRDSHVGSMNLTDDPEGWANAAHIAVAETQFMMGKFNRPQLFYAGGPLGPILTQFMSFPFQYLEMMIKNIRRMATPGERAIGARMLGLMLVAMVGMAGMFGIPFMENLRRFISSISDTDLEREARFALYPVLGKSLTNVLVGGSIFEYLGIEAKNRVGVGTMVDSGIFRGDIGFLFGPLGGVIETAWNDVGDGIDEGNIGKIAKGLIPFGFVRDVIVVNNAFEEGYTTRSGTTLIAPQDILPTDFFITFLGFNPANRALERDKQAYSRMLRTVGQRRRNIVMKRMTRLQRKAMDTYDQDDREEYMAEFRDELRTWNRKAAQKGWPPITPQLITNRLLANLNPGHMLLKRASKINKRELRDQIDLLDLLKPAA